MRYRLKESSFYSILKDLLGFLMVVLAFACFGALYNFDILEFDLEHIFGSQTQTFSQNPMSPYSKIFNGSLGMVLFSIGGLFLFRQKQWLRFDKSNGIIWVEEKKTPFHKLLAIPLPGELVTFHVNTDQKTSKRSVKEWNAVEGKMLATGQQKTSIRYEYSVCLHMKHIKPIEIRRFKNVIFDNGMHNCNTILNYLQSVPISKQTNKTSIKDSMLEALISKGKVDRVSNPLKYQWKKPFNALQRTLVLLLIIGLTVFLSEGKIHKIFGRDFYLGIGFTIATLLWLWTLIIALKSHFRLILYSDSLEYKFWNKSFPKEEYFTQDTYDPTYSYDPLSFLFAHNLEYLVHPFAYRALQYLFLYSDTPDDALDQE